MRGGLGARATGLVEVRCRFSTHARAEGCAWRQTAGAGVSGTSWGGGGGMPHAATGSSTGASWSGANWACASSGGDTSASGGGYSRAGSASGVAMRARADCGGVAGADGSTGGRGKTGGASDGRGHGVGGGASDGRARGTSGASAGSGLAPTGTSGGMVGPLRGTSGTAGGMLRLDGRRPGGGLRTGDDCRCTGGSVLQAC